MKSNKTAAARRRPRTSGGDVKDTPAAAAAASEQFRLSTDVDTGWAASAWDLVVIVRAPVDRWTDVDVEIQSSRSSSADEK